VKGNVGSLREEMLASAATVSSGLGLEIPVIPVGIEYDGSKDIYVRVGEPLNVFTESLSQKVSSEMASLSGIS
jgi:hypothetical protein